MAKLSKKESTKVVLSKAEILKLAQDAGLIDEPVEDTDDSIEVEVEVPATEASKKAQEVDNDEVPKDLEDGQDYDTADVNEVNPATEASEDPKVDEIPVENSVAANSKRSAYRLAALMKDNGIVSGNVSTTAIANKVLEHYSPATVTASISLLSKVGKANKTAATKRVPQRTAKRTDVDLSREASSEVAPLEGVFL